MAMNSEFDREVRFEIVESIGVLTTHSTGWNKELNLVSWNGGQPKYDIRDWAPDHAHMSRGVTLHEKEMRQIFELMRKRRQNQHRSRHGETGDRDTHGACVVDPTDRKEETEILETIAEMVRSECQEELPDAANF